MLLLACRNVKMENSDGPTGESQRVKLVLAVKVEKLEVDLVAACLRVNGKNIKENKYVKVK
jgi:stalled ribosome rescue protein Dom34